MLQFPTAAPPRTDSLPTASVKTNPDGLIAEIRQEVDDAELVLTSEVADDQELKQALGRMISRVHELSSQLAAAFKFQSDLETQLTLAKSNLQLSLANTEMLEEALKRDGDHGKDVGWRRWSSRENQRHSEEQSRDSAQPSLSRMDSISSDGAKSPNPPATPANTVSPPPPSTASESRFFKIRFRGSSRSPSIGHSSQATETNLQSSPAIVNGVNGSHLTSASLPSLSLSQEAEASSTQREEELNGQLLQQRKKYDALAQEKAALEAELESLSQALFEEANKMVATERIKLAEADDELRSTIQEKEALRSALKLIEKENDRLRQAKLERSDLSSEDNTQRTLLSPPSEHEEKVRDPQTDPEISHHTEESLDAPLGSQGVLASSADDAGDPDVVGNSTSADTVIGLTESTADLYPRPESSQHSPQTPSKVPDIDNPWHTFFRQNTGSGITSMS